MVGFCVLIVVSVIEVGNYRELRAKAQKSISVQSDRLTSVLSSQLGASVKFGDVGTIDRIVADLLDTVGADFGGALVFPVKDVAAFALSDDLSIPDPDGAFSRLAGQAKAAGTAAFSEDRLAVAYPVRFPANETIVGVVVTSWTIDAAMVEVYENLKLTLAVGFGIFILSMSVMALYLRAAMSRPLRGLEQAMSAVAAEDYSNAIPYVARKDEIGKMALRLDEFRAKLGTAKAAQREMAFKGAAFEGSSAAMMMVDEHCHIMFANPACNDLIATLMPNLQAIWPSATADGLEGAQLTDLAQLKPTLDKVMQPDVIDGAGPVHESCILRVGDRIIRVKISPAFNPTGEIIGCITEWSDRTVHQHNAALIDAINTGQLRFECATNGAVCAANNKFLELVGSSLADMNKTSLARMFSGNIDGDADGTQFVQQVFAGTSKPGRFTVHLPGSGEPLVLEGGFTLLRDETGTIESAIFLGTDVSASHKREQAAAAERAQSAQEIEGVVSLLGDAMNKLAEGDLQTDIIVSVPPAYEKLKADFNATVEALRQAIAAVIQNSDSIRNETTEITSAADDLSRRTEKQAATLEETAAALDELTVSVKSAAEGADAASRMSAEAQKNAAQGGDVARKAVAAMDGIKTSSQEISKITSVIDDIAFQTNLLALNAGVEAARAGEAGRGFAVVATEVRALAQRSSDAAREINALINSSGEQVQLGVELVDRTGTALSSILVSIAEISNRVSNIAGSAREQSNGLAEINTAVNELDHVTQQNAAMFEETTAASHALTTEADALVAAVSRFKMDGLRVTANPRAKKMSAPLDQGKPAAMVQPRVQGNAALAVSPSAQNDAWEEF